MKLTDLLKTLSLIGVDEGDVVVRRDGQLQIPCPLAKWFHESGTDRNPSLSIKYGEDTVTLFKCFACHERGKLWQLVDSYAHLKKSEELQKLADILFAQDKPGLKSKLRVACTDLKEWVRKPEYVRLRIDKDALRGFVSVAGIPSVCDYLNARGVSEAVRVKFNLLYDGRRDRIVFPVYDKDNILRGAVGRYLRDFKAAGTP